MTCLNDDDCDPINDDLDDYQDYYGCGIPGCSCCDPYEDEWDEEDDESD